LQPAEELDQKEWTGVHPFRLLQQLLVRLSAEDVGRNIGDGLTVQRPEADELRARLEQLLLRLYRCRGPLVRAEGQYPRHRQRAEPLGQLSHGQGETAAGPLEVVEADEQGVGERSFLEERLQVVEKPEHLLR
jgi:hypothetical protein